MITTVFVSSVEIFDESHPLFGCEMKICDQNENLAGHVGSIWGVHAKPDCPELIDYFICDYLKIDDILASKGWHRKLDQSK